MKEKILARGAEAILIQSGENLIKRRISKGYRLREIDEKLRKSRTKAEAKIMQKLENKISVPKIIKSDEKSKEIIMEFIQGKKLANYLNKFSLEKQIEIIKKVAEELSKIHDENLIHGDLTTSNMILVEDDCKKVDVACKEFSQDCKNSLVINNLKVYIIDFGLGFHSSKIEDKAVDLHLLKQALEAKHFQNWQKLFKVFISSYNTKDKDKILTQLEKVELRGRYKH